MSKISSRPKKKSLPLIVLTNDDGIQSPGLRALARAIMPLGELLIVAPLEQQSSMGRSFVGDGEAAPVNYVMDGKHLRAFAVPTSPAVTSRHAILLLADRPPSLLISGINYGENIGNGVTISGTVGAALEGANLGAPAMAVSVQTAPEFHMSHSDAIDFAMAARFAAKFAKQILKRGMPAGTDVLNVNVPDSATANTPWRWTRVSREAYFHSTIGDTPQGRRFVGYESRIDLATLEKNSDVRAVIVDHVVSVSPLTLDLTARVAPRERARWSK